MSLQPKYEKIKPQDLEKLLEAPFWRDKKVVKAYEVTEYENGKRTTSLKFKYESDATPGTPVR